MSGCFFAAGTGVSKKSWLLCRFHCLITVPFSLCLILVPFPIPVLFQDLTKPSIRVRDEFETGSKRWKPQWLKRVFALSGFFGAVPGCIHPASRGVAAHTAVLFGP